MLNSFHIIGEYRLKILEYPGGEKIHDIPAHMLIQTGF